MPNSLNVLERPICPPGKLSNVFFSWSREYTSSQVAPPSKNFVFVPRLLKQRVRSQFHEPRFLLFLAPVEKPNRLPAENNRLAAAIDTLLKFGVVTANSRKSLRLER
jgi:hypothetical protein